VDPVPDSENLVAPGIEPWISGSVAGNSDHQTTDAVYIFFNTACNRKSVVNNLRINNFLI
jgi:hypothetical protein